MTRYRPVDLAAEEWMLLGLCRQTDPDAFFPDKGGSTRQAKQVCARCEIRERCLQYALERDERFGIWGGLSERERRKLRASRPARSRPPRPAPSTEDAPASGEDEPSQSSARRAPAGSRAARGTSQHRDPDRAA